jgi:hypothetical protein
MTWTLSHDGKVVGEWTDQAVRKVAKQVSSEVLYPIYQFLPDPISKKLEGYTSSADDDVRRK